MNDWLQCFEQYIWTSLRRVLEGIMARCYTVNFLRFHRFDDHPNLPRFKSLAFGSLAFLLDIKYDVWAFSVECFFSSQNHQITSLVIKGRTIKSRGLLVWIPTASGVVCWTSTNSLLTVNCCPLFWFRDGFTRRGHTPFLCQVFLAWTNSNLIDLFRVVYFFFYITLMWLFGVFTEEIEFSCSAFFVLI